MVEQAKFILGTIKDNPRLAVARDAFFWNVKYSSFLEHASESLGI